MGSGRRSLRDGRSRMRLRFPCITPLLAALLPSGALADDVRVAAAGAAKQAVEALAPAFEKASGHRVVASFDTVGAQRDRVLRGERVDVTVLSDAALAQL